MAVASHPARDAWIEMLENYLDKVAPKSHPAWDAWIEMKKPKRRYTNE